MEVAQLFFYQQRDSKRMHFIYGYGNNNWRKKGGWKAAGKKRPNSSKCYDAGGLFLLINSLFNLFEDFFVIKKHKHNLFRSSIHAQTLNGWRPQWKCLFFLVFLDSSHNKVIFETRHIIIHCIFQLRFCKNVLFSLCNCSWDGCCCCRTMAASEAAAPLCQYL